jgi:hypothetical protein
MRAMISAFFCESIFLEICDVFSFIAAKLPQKIVICNFLLAYNPLPYTLIHLYTYTPYTAALAALYTLHPPQRATAAIYTQKAGFSPA